MPGRFHLSPAAMTALGAARERWLDPLGKLLARIALPLLLAYLVYAFSKLGLSRIWSSRPGFWLFYLFLIPGFFLAPLADLAIYRNLWGAKNAPPFSILLRKQFFNNNAFEYSGEGYFLFWAHKNLKLDRNTLVHSVKDSNVLSAGAALTLIWVVVVALAVLGGAGIGQFLRSHIWAFSAMAAIPLLLSLGLVVGGNRVTVLSRRQMAQTFAIHLLRSASAFANDLTVWWLSGALPNLAACFYVVALRLFVTRVPLLPRKDLVFVGVVLASAGILKISAPAVAAVAAILIASDQILGFTIVGIPWLIERYGRGDTGASEVGAG
jgi:hypothetical protein